VGWWNDVDFTAPPGDVILAQPQLESALLEKLYESPPPGERTLYVPLFNNYTALRPLVELRGYVSVDLWNQYVQARAEGE
jgi:hypothetical protein